MNRRLPLLLTFLLLLAAPASRAQTDVFSFTANDGKFYSRIKVSRVEDDGIIFTETLGIGGGRLKFSQIPEDIVAQMQALKPREKTFTDTLAAAGKSGDATEAASSNRSANGEKSDSATLSLTNASGRAICTFSRKITTNDINYLILITYSGPNYLGLGVADSLTFDADGALVTYSPVAGTHHVDTADGQMSESQVYSSTLRNLQKVCESQTLGLTLAGPLGSENFAIPATNILKNFGRFCFTNAAPLRAPAPPTASTSTTINLQSAADTNTPAQILDATARTIEDDTFTTQWAWKVTLRAPPVPPKDFLLDFQFLDAEGYVLAHEIQYPVKMSAGETNTFTGQTAVKTALTKRIKTCKVVMQ